MRYAKPTSAELKRMADVANSENVIVELERDGRHSCVIISSTSIGGRRLSGIPVPKMMLLEALIR